jgi:hypothetical protein
MTNTNKEKEVKDQILKIASELGYEFNNHDVEQVEATLARVFGGSYVAPRFVRDAVGAYIKVNLLKK